MLRVPCPFGVGVGVGVGIGIGIGIARRRFHGVLPLREERERVSAAWSAIVLGPTVARVKPQSGERVFDVNPTAAEKFKDE